jgi:WD40 repeat protein
MVLSQTFGDSGTILWNLATGAFLRELGDTRSTYRSIAFSPDGRYVASASKTRGGCPEGDAELSLTNVDTGEIVWETTTNYSLGTGIAFINGGRQIAAVHGDCSSDIVIWDAMSGEQVDIWEGQDVPSQGLAASKDGRLLAIGSNNGITVVWDVTSRSVLHTIEHDAGVRTVAFSPDSSQLLTVADDGILRLWDTNSGELVQQLVGHTSGVLFVDFSPNGRYIVSSGRDDNLFVWDLELSAAVRHLKLEYLIPLGHVAVFSPDGNSIIINDADHSLLEINLMLESDTLIDWVQANRYVRDLNCTERFLYQVEPLCDTKE